MLKRRCVGVAVVLVILGLWLCLAPNQVQAVPSFTRQTGMDCNSCHTVFPELTSVGRNFKINGFTPTKHGDKPYEWPPPVSAGFRLSFTNLNKSMPAGSYNPTFRGNDNFEVDLVTLWYGGRIYGDYLGGLIQGSYDGIENKFLLDITDVRLKTKTQLFNKDLVLGLTVNNAPTASDVLNTTAVWGFPQGAPAGGATALTPRAGPIIDGALIQQVGGIGGYLYWNNLVYAELAAYRTARTGPTQLLGAGTVTETSTQDVSPYWRMFLNKQWGKHSLQVGHFGLVTRILSEDPLADIKGSPNLLDTRGPIDRFTDLGFDAQYQFIGKKHIVTAQTSYIHEDQRLNNAFSQGGSFNKSAWLDTYKINVNYYYRTDNWGTLGGTVAYVNLWGSGDIFLYPSEVGTGSRVHKPNTDYWIFQFDYVPWWKQFVSKITIQYTVYSHFNGSRSLYDGEAVDTFPFPQRKASQNNSLFILLTQTF
ncbi:MAG: hypothetical protein M1438_07720 [Deltaproteobacteria bacterium]|nr:hypothetical protein [Deltaproteobacteria bacterium]